jgi:nucleoid-associated protein YgaU
MNEPPLRVFAGFGILVLLWIGVYWWWEPGGSSRISFAEVQPASQTEPAAEAGPEGPETGRSRVVPPSFVEHTVTASDGSLEEISRRFYGTPDHWRAIARANPLMDPERVTVGRVIRIPADPTNVQGRVDDPSPGSEAGPREPVDYVVLDGESLSTISQQFYGTTAHARRIFEHNRQRLKLKSMDSIRAGQTLVIPPLD